MPCEKYQAALMEAAVADKELERCLQEHLDVCDACRSWFASERSLLVAIDEGLRVSVNAPLPAALIRRFDARLAQQPQQKSFMNPNWTWVGGILTTAIAAFALIAVPYLRLRPNSRDSSVLEAPRQTIPTVQQAPPRFVEGMRVATRHRDRSSAQPRHAEPEVLVSPDERIAFERFLSDLDGREDLAVALVKPMQQQREQHLVSLEPPNLEIAAVTVEPISEIADR